MLSLSDDKLREGLPDDDTQTEGDNQIGTQVWIMIIIVAAALKVVYAHLEREIEGMDNDGLYWTPMILKIENGTILGKRVGEYTPIKGVKFY